MFGQRLFPARRNTPRNNVVSPALTGVTLSNLRTVLTRGFGLEHAGVKCFGPVIGLMQCTSSFVVAYSSERALRALIEPTIDRFLRTQKLALSRRGAGVARVSRKFSFLNFGIEGCGNALLVGPSGGGIGRFLTGVGTVVHGGRTVERSGLVKLLGPIVAN